MKKILQLKLKILAGLIVKKYRPIIVGITGSVGKTSAKEAIFEVIKGVRLVRMSVKNYNNEIGVPLTIIGSPSGGRNPFAWLAVFWRAWKLIIWRDKDYPQVLVLEMGVDRIGDMKYLVSFAPPQVGVVTMVSYSHLEYFGSLANIKKEKQGLIENISNQHGAGLAVLNYDNELAREMAAASRAPVLTYGLGEGADLRAQDISYSFSRGGYDFSGLHFKLNHRGAIVPVSLPQALGPAAVYAALAGAAVGLYFGQNLVEIASALRGYVSPPGRMRLLPGIKHTFIIDDTYNSSPEAARSAVEVLAGIRIDEKAKKYAVLGDMLEIGSYTEEGHRVVGKLVADSGIDYLFAVGERARHYAHGAAEAGLSADRIFHFDQPLEAASFLEDRIKEGDVILVKGSQGARLEKVVKEIMAEPDRAGELLVRQGQDWENS